MFPEDSVVPSGPRSRMPRRALTVLGSLLASLLLLLFLARTPPGLAPPAIVVTLTGTNSPLEIHPGLGGAFLVLPDGTLWRWGEFGSLARQPAPVPVDTNTDWSLAIGGNNGFLALKRNGELWQAGWDGTPGNASRALRRVGTGTNWIGIAKCDTAAAAIQADGSLWTWGSATMAPSLGDPAASTRAIPGRVGTNAWRSLATDGSNYGFLGITADGGLAAWGLPHQPGPAFATPTPIHSGTNWAWASMRLFLDRSGALWAGPASWLQPINAPNNIGPVLTNASLGRFAEAGRYLFEIRADGTLWRQWHPFRRVPLPVRHAAPGRVGERSDWIRLWYGGGSVFGLTRDGTLWAWGVDWGTEPIPSLGSRIKLWAIAALNKGLHLARLPPLNAGTTSASLVFRDEPRPLLRLVPAPAGTP